MTPSSHRSMPAPVSAIDLFRGTSTRFDRIEEEVTDFYIESFTHADLDGDGEFLGVARRRRMYSLDVSRRFWVFALTQHTHPTGLLNVEEFKEALRIHLNKAVPIEQVIPAFQKFDKTGDGFLDMQEFVLALVRCRVNSDARLVRRSNIDHIPLLLCL